MSGNDHPFDPKLAQALVQEWQTSSNPGSARFSSSELVRRIAGEAIANPAESDYLLLGLTPYQFIRRKRYVRFFRSTRVYVWKRMLQTRLPQQTESILDGVDGLLVAAGGAVANSGRQTRLDILLYDMITDNFAEEGFLSVAHQVVQRILGDIEKKPNNLIFSVALADHLDRQYQQLLNQGVLK
ncbi:MAG: hypothetical protein HQL67_00665 [Magnetococcales bacterium]|nr:hypothetical protein [Magnetococcales bacterium]